MSMGSVFESNRTQAIRLPAETRFPPGVKKVTVRVVGPDRIITPVDRAWDTFFLSDERPSDDFMESRGEQDQPQREPF
jgi:antitoxin VapB